MKSISKYFLLSLSLSMAGAPIILKGINTEGTSHHLNERAEEAAHLFIRFLNGVKMKWSSFIGQLIDLLSGNPLFVNISRYLYSVKDKKSVKEITDLLSQMLNDPAVKEEMSRSPEMKKVLDEIEKHKRSKYWIANKFNEAKWKLALNKLIADAVFCK